MFFHLIFQFFYLFILLLNFFLFNLSLSQNLLKFFICIKTMSSVFVATAIYVTFPSLFCAKTISIRTFTFFTFARVLLFYFSNFLFLLFIFYIMNRLFKYFLLLFNFSLEHFILLFFFCLYI